MSSEEQNTEHNILDKYVSKKETALTLASFGVGGLFAITFLDLGAVALGFREVVNLPEENITGTQLAGVALLGYVLGKKDVS